MFSSYENGSYPGGRCLEQKRRDVISLRRQLDRASQFAKNVKDGTIAVDDYNVQPYNKESSRHRARQDDLSASSSEEESTSFSHKNTKKAFCK